MNKPKLVKRQQYGGYKYKKCLSCGKELEVEKPISEISFYYCGGCGKIIENAGHSFCGWCGDYIDWEGLNSVKEPSNTKQ